MRIMLGYDPCEHDAYVVARYSIEKRCSRPVHISPISLHDLKRAGLYKRPTMVKNNQLWDVFSSAPMSTEFAISRFFIPHLVDSDDDWVLFADSDIVCHADIAELFDIADQSKAVMCVKHRQIWSTSDTKKVGSIQTSYPRKNWSSVVLWNVRHPAHKALTLDKLNTCPGRDLHGFDWLEIDQIGGLDRKWNWLVGVEPIPSHPAIYHFTLGGPWLKQWEPSPWDYLWTNEKMAYDLELIDAVG